MEAIPSGWQRILLDGTAAIERRWRFTDFHRTMDFVNAVAAIAHAQDHHPELTLGYGQCTVRYTTHDAGGLTARDLAAAEAVNALPQAQGPAAV